MLLTELELGTLTDRKATYCALYIVFFRKERGIVTERTERTPITYCPRNTTQWRIQHVNLLGRFCFYNCHLSNRGIVGLLMVYPFSLNPGSAILPATGKPHWFHIGFG